MLLLAVNMTYVFIALIVVALIVSFVLTAKKHNAIQKGGIEADAEVSRIEESENTDNDGIRDISYTYYVKYQTQDGKIVEAKLGNAPAHLYVGSTLRVKYLPEKPKYVIPAK